MVQVLVPDTRVLATVESTLQGGTCTLCDMHPNMLYFGNMHSRVGPNYAYFENMHSQAWPKNAYL